MRLSVAAHPGYAFDHWLVDGVRYNTPQLRLTTSEAGGTVRATPVMRPLPLQDVLISEVYCQGKESWVALYNPTGSAISLTGYSLSDNTADPGRYTLDGLTLAPGATLLLVGKSFKAVQALGHLRLGFNLAPGEELCLYGPGGQPLSRLHLRQIPAGQSYQYNLETRRWQAGTPTALYA